MKLLPVLLLVLGVGFTTGDRLLAIAHSPSALSTPSAMVPYLSAAELQEGKIQPLFLIDVRSPQEYEQDRIADSPLVPLDTLESGEGIAALEALITSHRRTTQKDFTVVLYCRTQRRSARAFHLLRERLEHLDVPLQVLYGGITTWRQSVSADRDYQVLEPYF